jgi:formylmethanofuran dehydrogenase subunit E
LSQNSSLKISPIGYVENEFDEAEFEQPERMREEESRIILDPQYIDGLYGIDEHEYLDIIFHFHKSSGYKLKGKTRWGKGPIRGVFACRSPRRPASIGLTTVKLLRVEKNQLLVKGLDALNGTPILDIKPHIQYCGKTLWEKAVEFHGHSCPGLAQGVVASKIALEKLGNRAKDEESVAIVENDACGVDAIQAILGCTFGKGNLIHKDYGKSVYTFYNRGTGRAITLSRKVDAVQRRPGAQQRHRELFEKVRNGTATEQEISEYREGRRNQINSILERGEEIFHVQEVNMPPPEKARIVESIICDRCKEPVMATRIKEVDGMKLCIPCFESRTGRARNVNGK